ncbi:MAG: CPBP family intramembrane glutamic endopeptidase [Solirubrobacteraceae bacterium]
MSVTPPAPASGPSPPVADGFPLWAPFAVFLIAIGTGSVALAVIAAAIGGSADTPGMKLGATFVLDATLIGAMVLVARLSGVRVSPAAFGLRPPRGGRAVLTAVLVFVAFYVFLIAWSQLDPGAEDDLVEDLGAKDSTLALVAVAVLTTLVAPFVEELFYRGFLFGALRRAMPWIWAAVLAGVLFGGIHLGTPAIFLVPLAVFGALLCVLYQRTDSLIPGMGVHAFNNALALGYSLDWTAAQRGAVLIAAPLVVMSIATALSRP